VLLKNKINLMITKNKRIEYKYRFEHLMF